MGNDWKARRGGRKSWTKQVGHAVYVVHRTVATDGTAGWALSEWDGFLVAADGGVVSPTPEAAAAILDGAPVAA